MSLQRNFTTGWATLLVVGAASMAGCTALKDEQERRSPADAGLSADLGALADAAFVADAGVGGAEDGGAPTMDASIRDAAPPDGTVVAVGGYTTRQSNGGGTTSSMQYRLRLSIGGPAPAGEASSPGYRLQLGTQPVGTER